jgi:hypothetical protein
MSYTEQDWQALARCAPNTGEEFDWYALDVKSRLGVFTTAGRGPVPKLIWSHREEINDLRLRIESLADVTSHERVYVSSGNHMEWYDLAWKGLFAFDYQAAGRYELIARPKTIMIASAIVPQVDLRWLPTLQLDFETCSHCCDSIVNDA